MATFEEVLTTLSAEPHAKGAAFERLCQWWLETDPVYTDQLKQVWLWDDWPGRWDPDIGIDLVAETHAGTFVQRPRRLLRVIFPLPSPARSARLHCTVIAPLARQARRFVSRSKIVPF